MYSAIWWLPIFAFESLESLCSEDHWLTTHHDSADCMLRHSASGGLNHRLAWAALNHRLSWAGLNHRPALVISVTGS